jgi:hypothetical protein
MGFADHARKSAASKTFEKSPNLTPGKYKFEVLNCLYRNGEAGESFIVELKILEAESTGELNRLDGNKPHIPLPVGAKTSYYVGLDPKNKSGPSNMKAFVCALLGLDPKAIGNQEAPNPAADEEYVRELTLLVNEDLNPAKGMTITDLAFNKPQKTDKGKDFTYHTWGKGVATPENEAHLTSIQAKLAEAATAASKK